MAHGGKELTHAPGDNQQQRLTRQRHDRALSEYPWAFFQLPGTVVLRHQCRGVGHDADEQRHTDEKSDTATQR